ncbi:MAG: hypothetical protein ACMUIA_10630 [bacterium]
MIRGRKGFYFCVVTFIFMLAVSTSPVQAQLIDFTLSPIDIPGGYGNILDPFSLLPGLRLDAATDTMFTLFSPWAYTPLSDSSSFFTFGTIDPLLLYGPLNLSLLSPFESRTVINPLAFIQFPYLNVPIPQLTTLNPLLTSTAPVTAPPVVRMAAQSGTWVGTWQSTYIAFIVLFHSGPMNLNIVVDPLGIVTGSCILEGSRYANFLFNVTGADANGVFTLSGFLGAGINIYLDGILTSPVTMTGNYTVSGTLGGKIWDTGVFNLTLI